MRHRINGRKFGRKTAPRALMLRNLAVSVLLHERVETTEAKAKSVRTMVERSISAGRAPSLSVRRQLLRRLHDPRAVAKTLDVLGPRFRERRGGYTRMTKLGRRQGDGAPMVVLELVS